MPCSWGDVGCDGADLDRHRLAAGSGGYPAGAARPSTAAQPETKSDPMAKTEEAKPAKPVEGQIVLQDQNSILASTLIGSTVYTPADETVGDINDVIVGLDGKIQGEIGVGGFLGLGEKDVAVQMDKLTVQPQDASKTNVRLILNSTKPISRRRRNSRWRHDPRDRERQHRQHHDAGPCQSAGLRLDQPVALGRCTKRPDMGRFVHF